MENNCFLPEYGDDDILSFANKLFKAGELKSALKCAFTDYERVPLSLGTTLQAKGVPVDVATIQYLLDKGIELEILRLGANSWQKGKLKMRISLEFIPNEPEEADRPLDEIPQMSLEENQ